MELFSEPTCCKMHARESSTNFKNSNFTNCNDNTEPETSDNNPVIINAPEDSVHLHLVSIPEEGLQPQPKPDPEIDPEAKPEPKTEQEIKLELEPGLEPEPEKKSEIEIALKPNDSQLFLNLELNEPRDLNVDQDLNQRSRSEVQLFQTSEELDEIADVDEDDRIVIKSDLDERCYKAVMLHNQMKVLLVSDPKVKRCAAALTVQAGSLMDPADIPGLAHFCEVILLNSISPKCPTDKSFQSHLALHGGRKVSCTKRDTTCFAFETEPTGFQGALRQFASFFISPTFTESGIEQSVDHINSEFEKHVRNDEERRRRVNESLTKCDHPYGQFDCGNTRSLWATPQSKSIDVKTELKKFFQKYYSANLMSLVVQGRQKIADMENLVVRIFSGIGSKAPVLAELPVLSTSPFGPDELMTRINLVPIRDLTKLYLIFPVPDYTFYYKAGIIPYITFLVGHEGSGSLISLLREVNWAVRLVVEYKRIRKGFAFFTIDLDLTPSGLKNVNNIIHNLFQYIKMLQLEGPQHWLWEEIKLITWAKFQFFEKQPPLEYVQNLVYNLPDFPPNHSLAGKYIIRDYMPKTMREFLTHLAPTNLRVIVTSKKCTAHAREEWLGARYNYSKIDNDHIQKWTSCGLHDDLAFPKENPFIPTNFYLKPSDAQSSANVPRIIQETELSRVWFLQDHLFARPKATIILAILSPLPTEAAQSFNETRLLEKVLNDALVEVAFDGRQSGLIYNIEATLTGLTVTVHGYDNKLHLFFDFVLNSLFHFTSIGPIGRSTEIQFESIRDKYIQDLSEWKDEEPYVHALGYIRELLNSHAWSPFHLFEAIQTAEEMTPLSLMVFARKLLSTVKLQWFFHGNFTEQEALRIYRSGIKYFNLLESKPIPSSVRVGAKEAVLKTNTTTVYNAEPSNNIESCCVILLQTGTEGIRETVLTEIIHTILKPLAVDNFQTTIDPITWIDVRKSRATLALQIFLQDEKDPETLEIIIEDFLQAMVEKLEVMEAKTFLEYAANLKERKIERLKCLKSISFLLFDEIIRETYNFQRHKQEIFEIDNLSIRDVMEFYRYRIIPEGPGRKKLCVLVASSVEKDVILKTNSTEDTSALAPPPPPPPFPPDPDPESGSPTTVSVTTESKYSENIPTSRATVALLPTATTSGTTLIAKIDGEAAAFPNPKDDDAKDKQQADVLNLKINPSSITNDPNIAAALTVFQTKGSVPAKKLYSSFYPNSISVVISRSRKTSHNNGPGDRNNPAKKFGKPRTDSTDTLSKKIDTFLNNLDNNISSKSAAGINVLPNSTVNNFVNSTVMSSAIQSRSQRIRPKTSIPILGNLNLNLSQPAGTSTGTGNGTGTAPRYNQNPNSNSRSKTGLPLPMSSRMISNGRRPTWDDNSGAQAQQWQQGQGQGGGGATASPRSQSANPNNTSPYYAKTPNVVVSPYEVVGTKPSNLNSNRAAISTGAGRVTNRNFTFRENPLVARSIIMNNLSFTDKNKSEPVQLAALIGRGTKPGSGPGSGPGPAKRDILTEGGKVVGGGGSEKEGSSVPGRESISFRSNHVHAATRVARTKKFGQAQAQQQQNSTTAAAQSNKPIDVIDFRENDFDFDEEIKRLKNLKKYIEYDAALRQHNQQQQQAGKATKRGNQGSQGQGQGQQPQLPLNAEFETRTPFLVDDLGTLSPQPPHPGPPTKPDLAPGFNLQIEVRRLKNLKQTLDEEARKAARGIPLFDDSRGASRLHIIPKAKSKPSIIPELQLNLATNQFQQLATVSFQNTLNKTQQGTTKGNKWKLQNNNCAEVIHCTVADVETEIRRLRNIKRYITGETRELTLKNVDYAVFVVNEIQLDRKISIKSLRRELAIKKLEYLRHRAHDKRDAKAEAPPTMTAATSSLIWKPAVYNGPLRQLEASLLNNTAEQQDIPVPVTVQVAERMRRQVKSQHELKAKASANVGVNGYNAHALTTTVINNSTNNPSTKTESKHVNLNTPQPLNVKPSNTEIKVRGTLRPVLVASHSSKQQVSQKRTAQSQLVLPKDKAKPNEKTGLSSLTAMPSPSLPRASSRQIQNQNKALQRSGSKSKTKVFSPSRILSEKTNSRQNSSQEKDKKGEVSRQVTRRRSRSRSRDQNYNQSKDSIPNNSQSAFDKVKLQFSGVINKTSLNSEPVQQRIKTEESTTTITSSQRSRTFKSGGAGSPRIYSPKIKFGFYGVQPTQPPLLRQNTYIVSHAQQMKDEEANKMRYIKLDSDIYGTRTLKLGKEERDPGPGPAPGSRPPSRPKLSLRQVKIKNSSSSTKLSTARFKDVVRDYHRIRDKRNSRNSLLRQQDSKMSQLNERTSSKNTIIIPPPGRSNSRENSNLKRKPIQRNTSPSQTKATRFPAPPKPLSATLNKQYKDTNSGSLISIKDDKNILAAFPRLPPANSTSKTSTNSVSARSYFKSKQTVNLNKKPAQALVLSQPLPVPQQTEDLPPKATTNLTNPFNIVEKPKEPKYARIPVVVKKPVKKEFKSRSVLIPARAHAPPVQKNSSATDTTMDAFADASTISQENLIATTTTAEVEMYMPIVSAPSTRVITRAPSNTENLETSSKILHRRKSLSQVAQSNSPSPSPQTPTSKNDNEESQKQTRAPSPSPTPIQNGLSQSILKSANSSKFKLKQEKSKKVLQLNLKSDAPAPAPPINSWSIRGSKTGSNINSTSPTPASKSKQALFLKNSKESESLSKSKLNSAAAADLPIPSSLDLRMWLKKVCSTEIQHAIHTLSTRKVKKHHRTLSHASLRPVMYHPPKIVDSAMSQANQKAAISNFEEDQLSQPQSAASMSSATHSASIPRPAEPLETETVRPIEIAQSRRSLVNESVGFSTPTQESSNGPGANTPPPTPPAATLKIVNLARDPLTAIEMDANKVASEMLVKYLQSQTTSQTDHVVLLRNLNLSGEEPDRQEHVVKLDTTPLAGPDPYPEIYVNENERNGGNFNDSSGLNTSIELDPFGSAGSPSPETRTPKIQNNLPNVVRNANIENWKPSSESTDMNYYPPPSPGGGGGLKPSLNNLKGQELQLGQQLKKLASAQLKPKRKKSSISLNDHHTTEAKTELSLLRSGSFKPTSSSSHSRSEWRW